MSEIRTKRRFFALWSAGALGNRPRVWTSVDALLRDGFKGLVTVRSAKPGGKCRSRCTVEDAVWELHYWEGPYRINEAAPDESLVLQGEVARGIGGLDLTYSTVPGIAMREAMRHSRSARGAAAIEILNRYLDPSSRDDVEALWDLYPDAVIEFGAYSCLVGRIPHRNTLIWEVRNY